MKKFLVLLMVLVLATIASAGLIDIVTTGYDDNDQSGNISPDDVVYLQVVNNIDPTAETGLIAYDLDLHVSGPGTLIEVDGGPDDAANHQPDDWGGFGWAYSGIADNAVAQMTDAWLSSFASTGMLVKGLAIICTGPGDVLVDLTLGVGGGGYGNPSDPTQLVEADLGDLTIRQIPEPITVTLLGLGGLLLRRRK